MGHRPKGRSQEHFFDSSDGVRSRARDYGIHPACARAQWNWVLLSRGHVSVIIRVTCLQTTPPPVRSRELRGRKTY